MKLAVLLVLLVACGKKHSECVAEANELGHFLTTMDHDIAIAGDDVHLVTRTELPAAKWSERPVVTLAPNKILFDGRRVETADGLAEPLAAARTMLEHRGPRVASRTDP